MSAEEVSNNIVRVIQKRGKAAALVDQLRDILSSLDDSDRFAIFRSITDGYCPECGVTLKPDDIGYCEGCSLGFR